MKKLFALILSLVMLLGLCACSEEEKSAESTAKPLRKEVVEVYQTDEKLANEVQALFDQFDKAFETLKNSNADDAAFLAYAETISDAVSNFGAFDSYHDRPFNSDNKDVHALMDAEYANLAIIRIDLSSELVDYYCGMGSAERCAEAAFGVVNSYSEFFYGEYRITDDDLDQLG